MDLYYAMAGIRNEQRLVLEEMRDVKMQHYENQKNILARQMAWK